MKKKFIGALLAVSVMCSSSITCYAGEWQQNATGYWYQNDDGTNPANTWQLIDGKWYFFDSNGYMETGWTKVNENWYYCEPTGEMRFSELVTDVFTFNFNEYGICTNFYENITPSTQAGWANYGTTSLDTWADAILAGNIVYYNGSYWATPDYKNTLGNEVVVYFHDVSADNGQDVTPVNRFFFADVDIDF
ncbi:MAG: hypothetical protein K1W16_13215 [Lachnospiraceae bacterium]